jgi:hypothetical protein
MPTDDLIKISHQRQESCRELPRIFLFPCGKHPCVIWISRMPFAQGPQSRCKLTDHLCPTEVRFCYLILLSSYSGQRQHHSRVPCFIWTPQSHSGGASTQKPQVKPHSCEIVSPSFPVGLQVSWELHKVKSGLMQVNSPCFLMFSFYSSVFLPLLFFNSPPRPIKN